MKLSIVALAAVLAAVPRLAASAEALKSIQISPREPVFTHDPALKSIAAGRQAPFVLDAGSDPVDLDFMPHPESRRGSPSSCDGEASLCYDPTNGHIVYKPAREYMPDLPGLQRENISVKRDRIVFRYSF
ncbi:MAG TPA: hypothetical protein VHQ02_14375 [Usitatibacter sp.]|jgi:hypothetical protein|nr:hypothetical protein [Usitatibacter sp.]